MVISASGEIYRYTSSDRRTHRQGGWEESERSFLPLFRGEERIGGVPLYNTLCPEMRPLCEILSLSVLPLVGNFHISYTWAGLCVGLAVWLSSLCYEIEVVKIKV